MSARRFFWRFAAVAMLGAVIAPQLDGPFARAGETAALQYRRVFVPADEIDEWPTSGQRYLPLGRDEFERLVKAAGESNQLSIAGPVQIVASHHAIKVREDHSLSGSSTFEVELIDDRPPVLGLLPWSPSLEKASWQDQDGDGREAQVGIWGQADQAESSQFGVLVDKSGTLQVEWTLAPSSSMGGRLEFILALPLAIQQRCTVETPAGWTVQFDSASVVSATRSSEGEHSTWEFRLGPETEHQLVVQPIGVRSPATSLPRASISESYSISPTGVEYDANFRIQRTSAQAGQLKLSVPKSLRLSAVSVNQSPTVWRPTGDADQDVSIALPIVASPIDVSVRAVGDIVLNESWTLPRIHARDVFWTEGTASLWIDSSIELKDLVPKMASLVSVVGLGQTDSGEAYRIQAWSPDSAVSAHLAARGTSLHVESHLAAEFADSELTGRCVARIWSRAVPSLQIEADIDPQWSIEAVESLPADALGAWHVADDGGRSRIFLQLKRAATAGHPIQLTLSARRAKRVDTTAIKVSDLEWIEFASAEARNDSLLVTDRRGRELSLDPSPGGGARSIATLSPTEKRAFGDPKTGLLISLDQAPPDAAVRARSSQAELHAEGQFELVHTPAGFLHGGEIHCTPIGGAVSEVVLLADRPISSSAQWTLVNSDEVLAVQPVAMQDADVAVAGGSHAYRVRLASPQSSPFRLRVAWRGEEGTEVGVVALTPQNAQHWQAWAILRGDPREVGVLPNGRAPAAAAPAEAADGAPLLACFRLSDDPTAPTTDMPKLRILNRAGKPPVAAVHCHSLDVTTLQFVDGQQTHRLVYSLEVHLDHAIELQVPNDVQVASITLNGESIPAAAGTNDAPLRIPLQGPGPATLAIDLRALRKQLDASGDIAPLIPKTSFTVLRGKWVVATPAPYAVESQDWSIGEASWRQRLFGPLLDSAARFNIKRSQAAASEAAAASHEIEEALIPAEWSRATQQFVSAPQPVRIRRIDSSRALRHFVWLASAVVSAGLWPILRDGIAKTLVVMGIACLLLPAAWVVLPQAILLGSMAGILAREVMRWTARSSQSPSAVAPSRAAAFIVVATGLLLATGNPGIALAEQAGPPPAAVLFPIEDNGMPSGDDVYIPVDLLEQLQPSSADRRYGGAGCVIQEARYVVQLEEDAAAGVVACEGCEFHFRVKTFRDGAIVKFPFHRRDAAWDAASATVDGSEVGLAWNDAGTEAALKINKAGGHQVTIDVVPNLEETPSEIGLSMHVPPLPGAQIEVTRPATVDRLTVDGVPMLLQEGVSIGRAFKGGSNTLKVSWPRRTSHSSPGVNAALLSWLHLDYATARLDVSLRLNGNLPRGQSLLLLAPPHLKMLPLNGDVPARVEIAEEGLQQAIELQLQAVPAGPITIPLQFQVQRSMSLGQFQFPIIEVLGVEEVQHQLAVSVSPRLRIGSQSTDGLQIMGQPELEGLWGPIQKVANAQYNATARRPSWALMIEPAQLQFSSKESLQVVCHADDVSVTYTADIDEVRGGVLTHHVSTPVNFKASAVEVVAGTESKPVPVRWTQPHATGLTLFLARPVSEKHQVRIHGAQAYAPDGSGRLPQFALENSQSATVTASIYRATDVIVELNGDLRDEASPELHDELGVFLATVQLSPNAPAPQFTVRANQPRFDADILLTMAEAPAESIEAVIVGRVQQGVVDQIEIATSPGMDNPIVTEPKATATAGASLGDASRLLLVKFAKPLAAGEEFRARISGVVALEKDQRLRFPEMSVANATNQRLFLMLPKTASNQTVEWTRRGLQRRELPHSLASAIGDDVRGETYLAMRNGYLAERRVFPDSLRQPALRYAGMSGVLGAAGEWSALGHIIVQPGGGSQISLKLPRGAELVQISCDGRPLLLSEARDGEVLLPASSRYLPRLISLAYRSTGTSDSASVRLALPAAIIDGKLAPLGKVLWQVEGQSSSHPASANGGTSVERHTFQTMARNEQIAALMDASPLAFQLPEWEMQHWFTPWLQLLGDANTQDGSSPELEWSKLRQRIQSSRDEAPASQASIRAPERLSNVQYFLGDADGTITLMGPQASSGAGRWLLAIAIGAIAIFVGRHPKRIEPAIGFLRRYPPVVGIAAGIFWWALLTPSLLGLAVVSLSIAALRKIYRQRNSAAESPPAFSPSTVVRAS